PAIPHLPHVSVHPPALPSFPTRRSSDLHTHNFDAVRYAWIADYDDAATFLNNFRTGDSQNTTQYSNPDYDRALVNAAKSKTAEEDRKSTRLNSSHVKISYAVFCLKKKSR